MRVVSAGRAPRHPLWSKESVLSDLTTSSRSIKQICEWYAPSPEKWRGYYSDVWRWRKGDPKFDMAVKERQKKLGKSPPGANIGRPTKDKGDKGWQEVYCEALLRYDGNREKASRSTPYALDTILGMLDPMSSSFDEKFVRKVRTAELTLAAKAEEMMFSSLKAENYADIELAKITQTKVWVADKVLSRMDASRWGKQVELHVSGKVEHKHQHGMLAGAREDVLARLESEQKEFMRSRIALPLPENTEKVIDVEVVPQNESVETRDSS